DCLRAQPIRSPNQKQLDRRETDLSGSKSNGGAFSWVKQMLIGNYFRGVFNELLFRRDTDSRRSNSWNVLGISARGKSCRPFSRFGAQMQASFDAVTKWGENVLERCGYDRSLHQTRGQRG